MTFLKKSAKMSFMLHLQNVSPEFHVISKLLTYCALTAVRK